ncbi:MAG: phosphoenolpyruvate carboxylase, partial [Pseudomonadales bacterium]|nr:phosphoenolpyruvate carboxylase [Pseudomonadales bacterium]
MLEDPDSALREDIRLLGGLLGRAIRASQGERIYSLVEEIRAHAKLAVQDESLAIDRIHEQLSVLGDQDLCVLARAYSAFLQLANIAEQHHRVRRRRVHQLQQDAQPQPGSLADLFSRLSAMGLAPQHIRDAVASLDIELVLTAHPTEVSRRTLIKKYDDIHDSLVRMDKQRMTPPELAEELDLLRCHVLSIWQTDEIRHDRPTPEDEARWGFTAIEQTLWQAVPQFMRELDRGMSQLGMPALDMHAAPLRFASWMGGDRDGNPNVTADVTERVLLLARWMAVDLFLRDVEVLRTDLSMRSCTPALQALAGEDSIEPYRDVLKEVRRHLQGAHERILAALDGRDLPDVEYYAHSDELYKPLLACHESLIACGMGAIARSGLTDVIRRVACFGLPLMRLDIRQESTRHARVLDAITTYLGEERTYLTWSEEERLSFLGRELESRRPLLPPRPALIAGHPLLDTDVVETLDTFRMLARSPQDALGAYVISMAHAASDVLAVQLLQKEMGVNPPMRVVPLFETLQDLEDAPEILRTLLASPPYRRLIQNRQEVMIGYSDSAKDAGFMAASWAQYRAQERLAQIAEEAGVTLCFFHGRGGSVSRGGAPAHQALLSQPPGTVRGRIRITEQGEMIRFKFGVPGVALRNLELYASATLEA